eukprot:m.143 g.143  ORF g.143 m.143 type:complete len:66 (+) comp775_c0_seq1:387-584(+)
MSGFLICLSTARLAYSYLKLFLAFLLNLPVVQPFENTTLNLKMTVTVKLVVLPHAVKPMLSVIFI